MRHLSIDIETYSSIDLKKSGMYKYAQSTDFKVLLIAYAWDNEPVQLIDLTLCDQDMRLLGLRKALCDPSVIKHAYNANFEWYCLSRHFGCELPLEQWRCTMLHGLYCGYTAGLGATGEAIGLPQDKRKLGTGMALIRTFCVPQKPSKANGQRTRTLPHHEPEKWELFKSYCIQDVVTEREIERRLSPWPVPDCEQRLWALDARMNAFGVMVDRPLIAGALACDEQVTGELMAEAIALTGLDNPKSVSQLTKWLEEEIEEDVPDLQKATVQQMLGSVESPQARRMLSIRQELGKASVAKYKAMQRAVCDDERLRGLLMFYGANRTGRWAGRIVQPQNLPRTYLDTLGFARELARSRNLDALRLCYGNVPDTLSQLIRTAFIPRPGCKLLVADFSAIEARVVAWLAGEQWRMDVFATHGKIYEASASAMFGVPIDEVSKDDRQRGKVAELALGYGGSTGALIKMGALNKGLTEDELPDIVRRWREASPAITRLWYRLNDAVQEVMHDGQPREVRGLAIAREWEPATGQDFLTIRLPSGRKLFYARPCLLPNKFGREALNYMGVDQQTKKWGQTSTFGGKLCENVVQAIARDCLAETLVRLNAAGYRTVFHVHDEVVIEAPQDTELKPVLDIMAVPIPWADGLLLRGDGFECEFYRKE